MSDAAEIRLAITERYKQFERDLEANEDAVFTFFQPTREVRMLVGRIGSSDAGLLVIQGIDLDENAVELVMHYTHLSYMLEAISTEKPRRVGFSIDAGDVAL